MEDTLWAIFPFHTTACTTEFLTIRDTPVGIRILILMARLTRTDHPITTDPTTIPGRTPAAAVRPSRLLPDGRARIAPVLKAA